MPGRKYTAGTAYRYGFNGKENDNEVKGEGNQQDYGARIYDTRIGKFLSVDPFTKKYAFYTPYQYAGNTPIQAVDLDGGEPEYVFADSKIRDFEANLRKSDPVHAEQKIHEYKKTAFLTVGSMLTGGSGELFMAFTDCILLYSGYNISKGIIKKDQALVKEGIQDMAGAMAGEVGGVIIGKTANLLLSKGRTLYNFGSKALGEMGEEALAVQYGTIKPKGKGSSMNTSLGARKPDGIPIGTTVNSTDKLFEAKVGFQKYSGDIINQVTKDAELLSTGKVNEITWVFYRSPSTGKIGASKELLQELQKAGIKPEVAGDIPKDIVNKAVSTYGPTPKK